MAAHAVYDLRKTYPEAEIFWAIDDRFTDLLGPKLVNQVLAVPRKHWKSKPGLATMIDQFRWYSNLRKYQFDYGFDLQGHGKTGWCLRLAKPKFRLAIRAKDAMAKALNPVFPKTQSPLAHDVDFAKEAVRSLLPCTDFKGDFLPGQSVDRDEELVTICTGAGHPLKQIPGETIRQISEKLVQNGRKVALLGAKGDYEFEAPGVQNLVGKTFISESILWIRKSAVHIAGDTGTGHISAAVGTPLVSIWGNMPFDKYRPYTQNAIVLNRNGDMNAIDVNEVVQAALGGFPESSH